MKGYIAIVSISIISAVLLLIVLSAAEMGISQSKMTTQISQSSENYYLAQACAEEALMKLKEDLGYKGDEIISLNGNNCAILSVEKRKKQERTVKVLSTLYGISKKIKIEIEKVNPEIEIKSWQEVADF